MIYRLEIANQIVCAEELIPLLINYQMLPQLLREIIIDRAIASITCTKEELAAATKLFFQRHKITNAIEHQTWLQRYNINNAQFQMGVTRKLRIEKWKEATWGAKLESYFQERKQHLDRVIYSMIRTPDPGIAQELYFRIVAGEETSAELARKYSIGSEADTNGIVGPVELGTLHPGLAKQLWVSQPGQIWQPLPFGKYFMIVRLEKLIPAQLDKFMRQRLLHELFENWLAEQINQLSDTDKAWVEVNRKPGRVKLITAAQKKIG